MVKFSVKQKILTKLEIKIRFHAFQGYTNGLHGLFLKWLYIIEYEYHDKFPRRKSNKYRLR